MQAASRRTQWVFACLVMLTALTVYSLTLAPDITWSHDGQDGGDLITAVMTGGVPHPSGYPTYLLLASPLTHLPWRNPAWRMNLFSALCASVASGLTALTIMRLADNASHVAYAAEMGGMGAGLSLALSPVLWSQAVIAEVYALGALCIALLLLLTIWSHNQPSGPRAFTFGATFGLALGASLAQSLSGLLTLIALGRRWKMWGWTFVGLAFGLCVFLVLPLRALNHSPVNWGDASTLDGFWWLVSAQLYRAFVFALPLDSLGARGLAWASMTVRQFTPIGALISGWGLLRLYKTQPGLAAATLAMFTGWSIFAVGYNTTDSYVHLIPAFVVMAAWLGLGSADLVSRIKGQLALRWGAALALPLAQLVTGWAAADLHQDHTAADFGQTIMAQAPDRAILVATTDAHTFTLWYHRYVLGQRPDVTIVDRDMLDMRWYRASLAREGGWANLESLDPMAELASFGRPLCKVSQVRLECM